MSQVWSEDRYQQLIAQQMRQGCKLMSLIAFFLYAGFPLLDYLTQYHHFVTLWTIRFSTALVFGVSYLFFRKNILLSRPFIPVFCLTIVASSSITLMCMVLGGYSSSYYAGINLVILGVVLLFPVGGRKMALLVSVILGIYLVGMLIESGFVINQPELLVHNLHFLLATAVIGVAAAYQTDNLKRESFRRYLEIEEAQANLQQQDEIKSRFFANLSHELKTPLTLILGPLNELRVSAGLTDRGLKQLQVAERNAQLLLKHVGDLLEVARLDAGKSEMSYSPLDVASLVRRIASGFESLAQEKELDFKIMTPPSLEVEVDPEKMERIILNLLSNAFKFSPRGGKVSCHLMSEGEEKFKLEVGDSGPGIPATFRETIFERFFQVEESHNRKFGGTGLGLSIVKEFVELHEGVISVGAAEEGGALFSLSLPKKAPKGFSLKPWSPQSKEVSQVEFQAVGEADAVYAETAEGLNSEKATVLVVEDNIEMIDYICGILKDKYQLLRARDGREGAEKALRFKPDLILSDIMMPEVSGVELVKRVRSEPALNKVPIILLTAKTDEELRVSLLGGGVQDYILKPFIPNEVLARVDNWISLKRSRDLLQSELQSSQEDMESLVHEMSLRKQELQRALQTRDEFISLASHELKTPLTSLKLKTELAQRKMLSQPQDLEELNKLFSLYENQLKRLIKIVNDMLDVSRIKTGNLELEKDSVDLVQLVGGVIDRVRDDSQESGIEINFYPQGRVQGNWDALRIEQVVLNLLANAKKYGLKKPVMVKVSSTEQYAVLEVQDQGMGINEEHHQRIFGAFERAVSHKHFGGLGLGLYLARTIIEAHGGSIRVESKPDLGARFIVTLPRSHP